MGFDTIEINLVSFLMPLVYFLLYLVAEKFAKMWSDIF